ncbi:MAG: hypothetical protein ACKOAH_21215, partial [Pirellula sp.]
MLYFVLAGLVLALATLLALALKLLPIVALLMMAMVGLLVLQRTYSILKVDPKIRLEHTRELVQKSPFFSKFLKAYPNGQLFWHETSELAPWGIESEKSLFQSSLVGFDRGYVLSDLHGLNE